MQDREEMSDLEKVARKVTQLVWCDYNKCDMFGEYWRCYTKASDRCPIYLDYVVKKDRKV